jgi:hypothetical protein
MNFPQGNHKLGHLKRNVLGQCIESHIGEHYQELILVKLMSVHYSNEPDIGLVINFINFL